VTRPTRRALIGVAVLAIVAAISIEWLWTSDEERVATALDAIQSALERRDADAVEPWLAPGVTFPSGVPGASAGGPLHDGIVALFQKIDSLKLRRDETTVTFDPERAATVVAKGAGKVEISGHPILFTFEVEAHLVKQPDARFLLDRVARVQVEPGIR
jgi:hypothetical protein